MYPNLFSVFTSAMPSLMCGGIGFFQSGQRLECTAKARNLPSYSCSNTPPCPKSDESVITYVTLSGLKGNSRSHLHSVFFTSSNGTGIRRLSNFTPSDVKCCSSKFGFVVECLLSGAKKLYKPRQPRKSRLLFRIGKSFKACTLSGFGRCLWEQLELHSRFVRKSPIPGFHDSGIVQIQLRSDLNK